MFEDRRMSNEMEVNELGRRERRPSLSAPFIRRNPKVHQTFMVLLIRLPAHPQLGCPAAITRPLRRCCLGFAWARLPAPRTLRRATFRVRSGQSSVVCA